MLVNWLRPSDAYMRQETNHHWSRWWLVAWSAPCHYLDQCWNIVNSKLRNKMQWNLKLNSYIFIQENAFENAVCEMAIILSRPQCVDKDLKTWHLIGWQHIRQPIRSYVGNPCQLTWYLIWILLSNLGPGASRLFWTQYRTTATSRESGTKCRMNQNIHIVFFRMM